jgi:hypothetical protein
LAVVGWRLITDKSEVATRLERDVLHNIVLPKVCRLGVGQETVRATAALTASASGCSACIGFAEARSRRVAQRKPGTNRLSKTPERNSLGNRRIVP